GDVFRSFRGADIADIERTFVRRTIITVSQNAAGQMSLTDLISNQRGALQTHIQDDLLNEMNKMGFVVDKVNLGASHLPDIIEKQLQQKMAAQQQAQQAEYELQRQQTLAKAKVAEAEGDAQSTLVRARAQAEANQLLQQSLASSRRGGAGTELAAAQAPMRRKEIHSASLAERVAVEQRIWDGINDELFVDPSLLELTHPTYESFFTAYPEYRWAYDHLGPSLAGRRILELGCGTGVL